ncbi:ABC transporter ATP-binding protein [Gordonia neofelifaecis]|uniref:ABC transporter related protein n=1 Tax=Gordonia neofelifaecis NRRL B-59395 TaxID=644548 RepID=F1YKN5_9ACTN|nr:ABC transporter ATP-binding protein [Gordonia neofelifaecis]EGD54679.1 ABC transporter related protein [Gordonia neofelifaecis NRRL B-59395]
MTSTTNRHAVSARGLTKRYGSTTALDEVTFDLPEHTICGLFGRNGAGKTTLMSILTAQNFATSGEARVFGEDPYENTRVLPRICFVRESQRYPEDSNPAQAFQMASLFFPNWDQDFADRLVADFRLPDCRRIKKLSRGQLSAVGVIIGLASRAEVTFFDEPYLGLDAVARQIFYDRLLEDYSEHPRTVLLSSHLIDEVSNLVEQVLVVDEGRLVLDESADDLRGIAFTVVGAEPVVDEFIADREELHRERLGPVASVTVMGRLEAADYADLSDRGLTTAPVSLQELIVRLTTRADRRDASARPMGAQR